MRDEEDAAAPLAAAARLAVTPVGVEVRVPRAEDGAPLARLHERCWRVSYERSL